MKLALFALSLLTLMSSAFATNDSVAFFYQPNEVGVLINDRTQTGRLDAFMRHFGAEDYLQGSTQSETIRFECGRGYFGISCVFKFYPAANVQIKDRSMLAQTSAQDMNLPANGAFEMSFASSMKDRFNFAISTDGVIRMEGSKKMGQR